ncbi:MAG: hypothetical protein WBG92_07005 [Thiohalocapsa sp.]
METRFGIDRAELFPIELPDCFDAERHNETGDVLRIELIDRPQAASH